MTTRQHKSAVAKSNIIGKLKKQVAGADYNKLPIEPAYQYRVLSKSEQLELFIAHLEANHAEVIKLDESDIAAVVSQQLQKRSISTLLCGRDAPYSSQITQLDKTINVETFDFNVTDNKEKLFETFPAAISSSRAAIAATGSIVLWPSKTEPRSLSLVPPVHIVIVDVMQLHADFSSLIKAENWPDKLPTNVLLISGPSKTADIQQTLAYGAHGPKELIVLLLNS